MLRVGQAAFVVACIALFLAPSCSGKAIVLERDNFDQTIQGSDKIWLIDFYAPWCGHCKRLAPVWDEAQATKGEELASVQYAKVDCTGNAAKTCSQYGVKSYPTIKVFMEKGTVVKEYKGGRSTPTTLEYAKRLAGPKITHLQTTREVREHLAKNAITFIYLTPSVPSEGSDELWESFQKVAENLYDRASLATAPEDSAEDLNVKITHNLKPLQEEDHLGGRLVAFRNGEAKCYPFDAATSFEAVNFWVDGHRYELLPKLGHENYRDIGTRGKPLAIAVLRGAKPKNTAEEEGVVTPAEELPINVEYLTTVKAIAREMEDHYAFGYLDGKLWEKFVEQYGISQRVLPRMLIVEAETEFYLPVPVDVKGHRSTVEFLERVHKGETKMLRSWSSFVKFYAKDYWVHIVVATCLVIFIPIAWMIYSDMQEVKKAKTIEEAKKAK